MVIFEVKMLVGIIKKTVAEAKGALTETRDALQEIVDKYRVNHGALNTKKGLKSLARTYIRLGDWVLDPANENSGNVREAADLYFLATYYAEQTKDQSFIDQIKNKINIYQAYNPLQSKDTFVREKALEINPDKY